MCQKILVVCSFIGALLFNACSGHSETPEINIIPQPKSIEKGKGTFTVKNHMVIGYTGTKLKPAATYLQSILTRTTGYTILTEEGKGSIQLVLTETQGMPGSYELEATPSKICITANTYSGIIAGIQTLRQLLPPQIEAYTPDNRRTRWVIPAVTVTDTPRFAWRGMMLDVSRHFYNIQEIKQLLDLMALYKLNKFHWHLTDDQGWRIQILKYPSLTKKGTWRKYNSHDRECIRLAKEQDNPDFLPDLNKINVNNGDTIYGGFYTQKEIKEIVAYAAVRGIDVIPEIDMPGHFLAAITNYPDIACSGQIGWGKTFSSPICPGKDETLEFCKDIYKEIFQLFPYEYVHLGADEVEKTNWKKCADCQKRMHDNGLKDEKELQAWFVNYMEKFFRENGKRLIGWDEILEGGLSPSATIMWWRNWADKAVPTATTQGNNVIIAPNFTLYFDAQQDKKTLKNVYDYDPVMQGLDEKQKSRILGAQANVWCEWIPSVERLQYMIMPRMLALSEICWVDPSTKNWKHFQNKVIAHFKRLNIMNINYRIPDLEGFHTTNAFTGETTVNVRCIAPDIQIRYTTDGSIPTNQSPLYTKPIKITETTGFTFRTFRPGGQKGDMVKTRYIKSEFSPAIEAAPANNGLKASWHEYKGNTCLDIEKAPVKGEYTVPAVAIPGEVRGNIGLVLTGYFNAPKDSIYTFALLSDDGSMLYIDNEAVINNDGPHSPREVTGQKALAQGLHPIKILYFDSNGGKLQMNTLNTAGDNIPFPPDAFKH